MTKGLERGTKLKTMLGADIVVENKLGEGGQGYVYKIIYNGQPKALKIYKHDVFNNPKAFYKNLKNNVEKGSPSPHFLWPIDMLKWDGNTFGYVMDLRPPEYVELVDLMNAKKAVFFASYKAAVTAALEMSTAFRVLHSQGYSYQDLSDGNFFINPKTGSILICDNDNVSEYGQNTGILGTPQYMAPEIVRGEAKPSVYTDRFSLAVVIFILLTMTHPLEGRRHLCEILTPKNEQIIYGTEPIFILDPDDHRNAPVAGVHISIGQVWPEFPQYIKDMFIKQFSKEIMMSPQRRATESDWQQILMRLRSDVVRCPYCGGDNLSYDKAKPICGGCGRPLVIQHYLKLSGTDYKVPIAHGNVVYRMQLSSSNIDVACDQVLLIRPHPKNQSELVLQNVSDSELCVIKPSGNRIPLKLKGAVVNESGTKIEAFGGNVIIE